MVSFRAAPNFVAQCGPFVKVNIELLQLAFPLIFTVIHQSLGYKFKRPKLREKVREIFQENFPKVHF